MKGSMMDMIFIPVILLIVAVGILVGALILDSVSTNEHLIATPEGQTVMNNANIAMGTFNWTFMLVAVELGLGSVALGFIYPSHPIFFVAGLLILVFSMVLTPQISNAFSNLYTSDSMSDIAGDFILLNWFMSDSLPLFIAIIGMLMLIVLFSKIREGNA